MAVYIEEEEKAIIRALNYDLDDNMLKQYYPNPKSYKNGYTNVKDFLCNNGFNKRQYSGVVSKEPLTISQVNGIIDDLNNAFEWLGKCVLKFDVTEVGETYSLKNRFSVFNENEIDKTKSKKELEDTQNSIDELNKSLKELGIGNVELNTKSNDYTKGNEL